MKNYKITVSDSATYIIAANEEDKKRAEDLAIEYFQERNPKTSITITDEEPEYSIPIEQ